MLRLLFKNFGTFLNIFYYVILNFEIILSKIKINNKIIFFHYNDFAFLLFFTKLLTFYFRQIPISSGFKNKFYLSSFLDLFFSNAHFF